MLRIQVFLFVILLIISLILIILNPNIDLYISNRVSEILLFPVRVVTNYLQYLYVSQKKIDNLESEISKLRIENQFLKNRLGSLSISDTISELNFKLLKANIIGRAPSNFNGFLYIDKGQKDGLSINNPVILQDKLVGRIKSMSEDFSIVETLENEGFAISAVDYHTGVYGIVKKKKQINFEYIKIDDEINTGDSIYTSGLSEVFPKGILIGTIADIRKKDDLFFKEIIISPAIKINRLNYVYVIY